MNKLFSLLLIIIFIGCSEQSTSKLKNNRTLANVYFTESEKEMVQYNMEEVIRLCNKAIEIDSTFIEAYAQKALAEQYTSRIEDAIIDYEKVIAFDSILIDLAYYNKALCKFELGDSIGGKENLEYLFYNSTDSTIIGEAYYTMGNHFLNIARRNGDTIQNNQNAYKYYKMAVRYGNKDALEKVQENCF